MKAPPPSPASGSFTKLHVGKRCTIDHPIHSFAIWKYGSSLGESQDMLSSLDCRKLLKIVEWKSQEDDKHVYQFFFKSTYFNYEIKLNRWSR